jgi:hypothetical protein
VARRSVVVGSPEVYGSSRLLSLLIGRLAEEYEGGIVVVASPPEELERSLWGFLRWKSPYGVDGLVKRLASHYITLSRTLVAGDRESEIVRGEVARLSEELRWLLWAIASSRSYTWQQAALLLTYPAKLSAAVTAAALRSQGVEAVWLSGREAGLLAEGHPLNATLDSEAVKRLSIEKLEGILERGVAVVLAGGVAGAPTAGGVKLLGWGGEVAAALAVAEALGYTAVDVFYGEKGISTVMVEGRARGDCPVSISVESLSLAAAVRAVRLPAPLPETQVELRLLGLSGCESRVAHKAAHITAFVAGKIYAPSGEVGEEYCPLASVNIPGAETDAGLPFERALYCTSPRTGRPRDAAVAGVGPLDTLSQLARLEAATILVRSGELALAVWRGELGEVLHE